MIDRYDILFLAGLALLGLGLYLVLPWLALVVVGAIVLAVAILGSWAAARKVK